ncbi:hypothetical protein OS493_024363 [Desmophyllum pertusum]|uniref:Serine/threonine-protein kinase greatwall n=1 Tax=Desmophyllum pertusum TaxID=174260 RepID=A0A9X0CJP7_9CNID|nr:hypothetical protein OS493_024363 [Desmophyllum pertusum]
MEFLNEKGQATPANRESSERGRAMSTLTTLTSETQSVMSPEVPFTSGYVSGTNSSGSELDQESPDKSIDELSNDENSIKVERNKKEKGLFGTCELLKDKINNGVRLATEKADITGSSGFNESPCDNSPSQHVHANNQTPSKSKIEISDEVMQTAGEKRCSSFSRRRESGIALLPPSPNVSGKNVHLEEIPVPEMENDTCLSESFGLASKLGHAATDSWRSISRERSMTIEFEGKENMREINIQQTVDNNFEEGEVFLRAVDPFQAVTDHSSADSLSRPRCLTIPFENSDDQEQHTYDEGNLNQRRDSHMDISLPVGSGSPLDVTFKSCASSKGTPGAMEVSHQQHHTSAPLIRTPFRTPKSCRRGNRPPSSPPKNRILAPAVDWWSLGVCLYEFLTGVPPFNDDTPELVFSHIMERELLWPEGDEALSQHAVGAVENILILHAEHRPGAKEIESLPFFSSLDWSSIHSHPPPFVPRPDDITDTTYFNARNTMQNLHLSSFSH